MHVPITIATLALITFAVLLLRIFWLRVPATARFYLIRAAILVLTVHVIFTVTKWSTASDHVNTIIKWSAIVSYELLLMLFTRLTPRWLTSLCGVILLLPVFASSVLLPLTYAFDPSINTYVSIGNNLYYERVLWGDSNDLSSNSGADILLSYRPRYAPFLRRYLRNIPFNNQQCNSHEAFALLGPAPKTAIARCPHWPSQPPGTDDWNLNLP